MDTYLAIASRREGREYADRPLPDDVVRRILDAGRAAGSAQNRQPWRFFVIEPPAVREELAKSLYVPGNALSAALVVAIAVKGPGPTSFDAGRAAQNMLLEAWNEGVVSVPNGFTDSERAAQVLGLGEDERPVIVLTFGYPARPRDPQRHSPEEWSARANRKSLDELVTRL